MDLTSFVVLGLLLLAVVACGVAWLRLRSLREGGVHVAVRTVLDESGRGWRLGIGHYRGDVFEWYRMLGLRSRPDRVIARSGLEIGERREPTAPESYAMPAGATVVRCESDTETLELAMGTDAMTGFLSWLESAPPSRNYPYAS